MSTTPSVAQIAPRSSSFVFGLIVTLLGLVLTLYGVSSGSDERALARDGRVVQGTVIEKRLEHVTRPKKGGGREERTVYFLRYRFPTGRDTFQEGEQPVGESLWRGVRDQGPVAIRYLERNPFANRPDAEPGPGPDVFLIIGGLLLVPGVVFFTIGLRTVRRSLALLRDGTPRDATITKVDGRKVRGRTTYHIHYAYETPDGAMLTGRSLPLNEAEAAGWRVGNTGRIMIDPSRPSTSVWVGARRSTADG